MGRQLYLDVDEFIRHRNFDVLVPAFYYPHIPDAIARPSTLPLPSRTRGQKVGTRRPQAIVLAPTVDADTFQKASYSIEVMLDMFQRKVVFEIVNDDDLVELFHGLDRYLMHLKGDIMLGNEEIIRYARLVLAFRQEMYKHYYRYMQTNEAAKAELYPNGDMKNNLFALLTRMGSSRQDGVELDPLRAKAVPPYDIDKILPSANVEEPDVSMVGSFGVGHYPDHLKDDAGDFDLDAFLNRKK